MTKTVVFVHNCNLVLAIFVTFLIYTFFVYFYVTGKNVCLMHNCQFYHVIRTYFHLTQVIEHCCIGIPPTHQCGLLNYKICCILLMQFLCTKNIRAFLNRCRDVFMLTEDELFDVADLWLLKNVGKVRD